MITGKLYNWLKFLALVGLPAVGTLYVALAALWGLPSAEAVSGSILAVDTFLGTILQISSTNYNSSTSQGTLHFLDGDDKLSYQLEVDGDPAELKDKERVVLKVSDASKTGAIVPAKPRAKRRTRAS